MELCDKCGSISTDKVKSGSITMKFLEMVGYCKLCCEKCGHNWSKFSLFDAFMTLVFLLIAVEAVYLLLSYFQF